jgi:hypothetical protein
MACLLLVYFTPTNLRGAGVSLSLSLNHDRLVWQALRRELIMAGGRCRRKFTQITEGEPVTLRQGITGFSTTREARY